jgi:hypothetical protein
VNLKIALINKLLIKALRNKAMFNPRTTAFFGLALIFSLQPVIELPVSSQTAFGLQVTTKQNSTCQSQTRLLLKASEGLLYPSESDYPFQDFYNSQTYSLPSPQQFASLIEQQGQQVTQVNFDEFFNQLIRNQRSSGTDAATLRRYQFLRQAFKTRFTSLSVYRVGQIQVQVYIIGVNSSCGMAGLKTISIET